MPALPSSLRDGFKLLLSAGKEREKGRGAKGSQWSRLWTRVSYDGELPSPCIQLSCCCQTHSKLCAHP